MLPVQKKTGLTDLASPVASPVSIMSPLENPAAPGLRTCVSANNAKSNPSTYASEGPATGSESARISPPEGVPVTRSPYDVWHSEAYLIGWLVKTHGWRVISPGLIRRGEKPRVTLQGPDEAAQGQEVAQ